MATTTFIDNSTLIQASWLNDVNTATYTDIPAIKANSWVTTARIADLAVTANKLAAGAAVSNIGFTPATDSAVVHNTGNETIAGVKTFTSQPVLPQALTAGTAVATTSGTSVDITGIPSWAKRITITLKDVSTSGTAAYLVQVGSSSISTSGYVAAFSMTLANAALPSTTMRVDGFNFGPPGAATSSFSGQLVLTAISGSTYVCNGVVSTLLGTTYTILVQGSIVLSGAMDRIRLTTTNGTDTFDAGSINILYE